MSEAKTRFQGPLFLIGMPRSGTKLLRAILNEHAAVAIPETETEFLPWWVTNWSAFGDLSDERNFRRFYQSCQRLPFFMYLNDAERGIDVESWYRKCHDFSPAGVFETLIRLHLGLNRGDGTVWGDKSPSYLTQLPMLKQLYPRARFLHIVRDVRDYCLSINRAWGKNVFRAAQRWSDDVAACRSAGLKFGDDYLEIRYEDLLHDPVEAARRVCAFVGVPYYPDLLKLSQVTENIGDARGMREIATQNVGKFSTGLDEATIRKIEAMAGRTLREVGYACEYDGRPKRLGAIRLKYLQVLDGVNLILFSARDRGMLGALLFVLRYFVVSGNRQKART
jgi:hypothetical protein